MAGAVPAALPLRGGMGLKPAHFTAVLESAPRGAAPHWVEVHPQNYCMDGGPMLAWLDAVRNVLPLSFHSVGLSLGDPGGCNRVELDLLAGLAERFEPTIISDHLSWSSLGGEHLPDLLESPLTKSSADHFVAQISRVQDRLRRPILVENPSRMLAFRDDCFDEPDFLSSVCRRSGCGLLLDVNNVLVSSRNLGFDPVAWIESIDPELVGEIHVAGHSLREIAPGRSIAIDDHGSSVSEECWNLLQFTLERTGPRPVLVERDNAVPEFADLVAEVLRADQMISEEFADAA